MSNCSINALMKIKRNVRKMGTKKISVKYQMIYYIFINIYHNMVEFKIEFPLKTNVNEYPVKSVYFFPYRQISGIFFFILSID